MEWLSEVVDAVLDVTGTVTPSAARQKRLVQRQEQRLRKLQGRLEESRAAIDALEQQLADKCAEHREAPGWNESEKAEEQGLRQELVAAQARSRNLLLELQMLQGISEEDAAEELEVQTPPPHQSERRSSLSIDCSGGVASKAMEVAGSNSPASITKFHVRAASVAGERTRWQQEVDGLSALVEEQEGNLQVHEEEASTLRSALAELAWERDEAAEKAQKAECHLQRTLQSLEEQRQDASLHEARVMAIQTSPSPACEWMTQELCRLLEEQQQVRVEKEEAVLQIEQRAEENAAVAKLPEEAQQLRAALSEARAAAESEQQAVHRELAAIANVNEELEEATRWGAQQHTLQMKLQEQEQMVQSTLEQLEQSRREKQELQEVMLRGHAELLERTAQRSERLEEELRDMEAEQSRAAAHAQEEMVQLKEAATEQEAASQRKNEELKRDLAETALRREDVAKQAAEQQHKQCSNLEEALAALHGEHALSMQQSESAALLKYEELAEQSSGENRMLQSELTRLQADAACSQEQIQQLQAETQQLRSLSLQLRTALQEADRGAKQEMQQLREQLSEAGGMRQESAALAEQHLGQLQQTQEQLDAVRIERAALQEAADSANSMLQQRTRELREREAAASEEVQELQASVARLSAQVLESETSLQRQMQEQNSLALNLHSQLEKLQEDDLAMRRLTTEARHEKRFLQQELDLMKAERLSDTQRAEEQLHHLQAEVKQSQGALREAEHAMQLEKETLQEALHEMLREGTISRLPLATWPSHSDPDGQINSPSCCSPASCGQDFSSQWSTRRDDCSFSLQHIEYPRGSSMVLGSGISMHEFMPDTKTSRTHFKVTEATAGRSGQDTMPTNTTAASSSSSSAYSPAYAGQTWEAFQDVFNLQPLGTAEDEVRPQNAPDVECPGPEELLTPQSQQPIGMPESRVKDASAHLFDAAGGHGTADDVQAQGILSHLGALSWHWLTSSEGTVNQPKERTREVEGETHAAEGTQQETGLAGPLLAMLLAARRGNVAGWPQALPRAARRFKARAAELEAKQSAVPCSEASQAALPKGFIDISSALQIPGLAATASKTLADPRSEELPPTIPPPVQVTAAAVARAEDTAARWEAYQMELEGVFEVARVKLAASKEAFSKEQAWEALQRAELERLSCEKDALRWKIAFLLAKQTDAAAKS